MSELTNGYHSFECSDRASDQSDVSELLFECAQTLARCFASVAVFSIIHKMAVSAGSPTVSDVKGKLQGVLVELEKYKDLYRTTNHELEIEKDKRIKVI